MIKIIEMDEFLDIMNRIGFNLIIYYADIFHRHETDIPPGVSIVNNSEVDVYTGCWYSGGFFKWLLNGITNPTNRFNQNKIIFGYLLSDKECHYFTVMTTDNEAVILNTYGGISKLIINRLSLYLANSYLDRLRINDVSSISLLFGVHPTYETMIIDYFELEETQAIIPIKEQIKGKIDELIILAHSEMDRNELYRLKNSF